MLKVTARALWLEQWCPMCRAAPGHRCKLSRWEIDRPLQCLHVARGWLERPCPRCEAPRGQQCLTPNGRAASQVHAARLNAARWELVSRAAVWETLELRGATAADVHFSASAGRGGQIDLIRLYRREGDELVEVERWTGRDELSYALEAPVWERFGTFAGHPHVRGELIWTVNDRRLVITARRGDRPFEEPLR